MFSGNFVQGGIEGVIAIGSAIFAGDQKQKAALKEAQAPGTRWPTRSPPSTRPRPASRSGPLTSQIQQLAQTEDQLVTAAAKAGDTAAVRQIQDNFYGGVRRIVAEFEAGAQTLSPLQQAMKAVNDEARASRTN
jgi:hypothetical protein